MALRPGNVGRREALAISSRAVRVRARLAPFARSGSACASPSPALARTFLAGAPVIVLDEPTGHLDPETAEALIGDALRAADSRSVLLITHRPEGLDSVDEVITLQRGRIVSVRAGRGLPAPV
jgi:ABC-type lipoprotein export system ATPase subunit